MEMGCAANRRRRKIANGVSPRQRGKGRVVQRALSPIERKNDSRCDRAERAPQTYAAGVEGRKKRRRWRRTCGRGYTELSGAGGRTRAPFELGVSE